MSGQIIPEGYFIKSFQNPLPAMRGWEFQKKKGRGFFSSSIVIRFTRVYCQNMTEMKHNIHEYVFISV